MSVSVYPEYKDSGVEGLGRVPSHWTLKRLRFAATLNPTKSEIAHLDRDTELSFLPMDAVGEDGSLRLDELRSVGAVETGYTFFREGDVAFAKITPCFENGKGAILRGLVGGYGFGTTELTVLRPVPGVASAEFLNWIICSPQFRAFGEGSMYGAGGQKRVPDDFARDFAAGFPSVPEQTAIASFLDRETSKIDALVEEQRRLIALLKEKRQAVISGAVTKGLDPNAPMKDSGVEWLGEVPAHWTVAPLKYIARVQTGVAKGKDMQGRDSAFVPYLRVANVQDGYLDLSDVAKIEMPLGDIERYLLQDGDVLMNEGGDFDKLGRGDIWRGQVSPCIHQNHVFAVRPTGVSSEWLNTFTGSSFAQFYFMGRSKQSTNLASISSRNVMDLPVVVPPSDEQLAVAQAVKSQVERLLGLIDQAETAIALLAERRAALISAAVTGKIDVRSLAQHEAVAA